jgi:molybdopterin synthase sulfur carrier subunit
MKINVLIFGSLVNATQGRAEIQVKGKTDLDSVRRTLLESYPLLADYTFRMALNQQITEGNVNLKNDDVVALLPPFAGG